MQIFSLFKVPARRGAFLLAPLISAILLRIAQSVVCIFEADRSFENETRWTKIETPPKSTVCFDGFLTLGSQTLSETNHETFSNKLFVDIYLWYEKDGNLS